MNSSECIESLQLILNCMDDKLQGERDKMTKLIDLKPSSFEFVIKTAINLLNDGAKPVRRIYEECKGGRIMEKYKQRMIAEYVELHNRYCDAVDALFDENIPAEDRNLIREQAHHMKEYLYILRIRIERAGIDFHALEMFMGYKMIWRFE